jgi:coenzyme F420 hydrogenase subunit beta
MFMKSYLKLKEEVWDKNICSGCGACTSVCPVDNLYFKEESPIKFVCDECSCSIAPTENGESPLSAEFCKTTLYDVKCGACYDACPRTMEKKIHAESGIGRTISQYKAKTLINVKGIQDGGVVTALLSSAFDEGLIDCAIVMMEDKWTMKPNSFLACSKEEVLESVGSRYNWNVPILQALREAVFDKKLNKIAIVGTPCVIDAIFQILASDNDLLMPFRKSIRLKISLFCFETFLYEKIVEKLKVVGVNTWDVKKLEIVKGKLVISLIDGVIHKFELKGLDDAIRNGCKVCKDFTGITSDISVGSVGTEKGYSTMFVRNEWGQGFVDRAVLNGYLVVEDGVELKGIEQLVKRKSIRGVVD